MKIDFEIAILLILTTNLFFFTVFTFVRRSLNAKICALNDEKERLVKEKERLVKELENSKKEVLTIEAKDLLSDLCRGSAVVKITPLDPKFIFEYSPRG